MKELKIEKFDNTTKNALINIKTNEYCLYNSKKHNKKIIGFYTDGIATCSIFIISINDDEFLLFSHIHEDSNIIDIIKNKVIPEIISLSINNITIIYSLGIGSIRNSKKEAIINEIIEIIGEKFISNKIVKLHDMSISCCKFIKNSENENQLLFQKIVNYQRNLFKTKLKSASQKLLSHVNNSIISFENSIHSSNNLMFYFDTSRMIFFGKTFNFIIL